MAVPRPPVHTPPISIWQIVPLILAALLLFLLPKTKELRVRLGLATAVVLLIALAGCSSSSANCRERDDHRNILRLSRQCEPFGHGGCNRRLAWIIHDFGSKKGKGALKD